MKKTEKALVAHIARITQHTNNVLDTLSDPDMNYLTLYDCYKILSNLNRIYELTDNAIEDAKRLANKVLEEL